MRTFIFVLTINVLVSITGAYRISTTLNRPIYNGNCYECPQVSSFSVSVWTANEKPTMAKFIPTTFNGDKFSCSYWVGTYRDKDGRDHDDNFIGRCVYDENGYRQSGSSKECWRRAPRDDDCAKIKEQNAGKGTFLKKCNASECAYETAACYTCPKIKASHVDIDTRNSSLQCQYYNENKAVGNCQYNDTTGNIQETGAPALCQRTAPQDRQCVKNAEKAKAEERQRQEDQENARKEREAKKKEEEGWKKYYEESGLWAPACETFLRKAVRTRSFPLQVEKICRLGPEKAIPALRASGRDGEKYAAELESFIKESKA